MQRRNFLGALGALFATKALPKEVFASETIARQPIFVDKKGLAITEPAKIEFIPPAKSYYCFDAMEDLKMGDVVVRDVNSGEIRKARFDSDLPVGVVVGPSTLKDQYIVAVH